MLSHGADQVHQLDLRPGYRVAGQGKEATVVQVCTHHTGWEGKLDPHQSQILILITLKDGEESNISLCG